MQSRIPLYRIEGVTEAKLEDNAVRKLEDAIRDYTGYKYVIGVSSGTTALFVAATVSKQLGCNKIYVPHVVFSGAISAFSRAGISVVYSPQKHACRLLQHLGCSLSETVYSDRSTIEDISHVFGRPVFETYRGSSIAICSLHASKPLQSLEGGLILTNEKYLHDECRAIVDLGRSTDDRNIFPEKLGMNFRMHPLAASIARRNLLDIDEINYCRRERIEKYRNLLDEAGIEYQRGEGGTCYMIALIDNRDDYISHNPHIGLGVHYPFYGKEKRIDTSFNDRCVSLPLWSGISDDDVEQVIDTLINFGD